MQDDRAVPGRLFLAFAAAGSATVAGSIHGPDSEVPADGEGLPGADAPGGTPEPGGTASSADGAEVDGFGAGGYGTVAYGADGESE